MNTFHATLFGLAASVAFAPAMAQPEIIVDASVPTATISYADLNLNSAAGRQTLTRRAKSAAFRLCTEAGVKPVKTLVSEHRCVTDAMLRASADIDRAVANRSAHLASSSSKMQIAAR